MNLQNLFDDQQYSIIIGQLEWKLNNITFPGELLFYMKSKITLNNFQIPDLSLFKKLYFLYWILVWKVEFENAYFNILNSLDIKSLKDYSKIYNVKDNYEQFFDLVWKDYFKEQIKVDFGINDSFKKGRFFYVNNLEDYFFALIIQYNNLYLFKGEDFVFHKWFVREVEERYFKRS